MTDSMTDIRTDKPPTIFLHGFSGDQHGLRPFALQYVGDDAICINLPGFGGSEAPSQLAQDDFSQYVEETWQRIRAIVPLGKVRLVGHSHGTMVGFAIACAHTEDVIQLDLLCPVARPRLLPRALGTALSGLSRLGLDRPLLRIMAWRPLVDAITRYSYQANWDEGMKKTITDMRRGEAKYYNPTMFKVMQKAVTFTKIMASAKCSVPTMICYVADDNVSGGRDHIWYTQHANVVCMLETLGGHLCVVAEPDRIAREFLKAQKENE